MEYIYIVLQMLAIVITVIIPPRLIYLLHINKIYKSYLIVGTTIQVVFVFVNVIFLFQLKECMLFVFVLHIITIGLTTLICNFIAKGMYFNDLQSKIIENNLLGRSSLDIRHYLLEKYNSLYFLKEIEKCISKMQKTKKYDN